MIVLGLDTSTFSSTVALRLGDGRVSEMRDDPPAGAHPGHATRLLDLARELLERAELGWGEIERIAVGVGPGTFTGLRVGIATARGLAQSLEIELMGISSLQALAHSALAAEPEPDPDPAAVLALIDARRGEVFAAAYERGPGAPVELTAPAALPPAELDHVIASARAKVEQPRWLAVGDGAVRYREHLRDPELHVPGDDSPLHRVSAGAICLLAGQLPAGEQTPLEQVLPDYRRRPDAELTLQGAGATAQGAGA